MDKKDIGKKIKLFRTSKGLTQAELAEMVSMHEKQISRIEAGIHFPTFDNFVKILECLKIEMKDFDIKNDLKLNPLRIKIEKIINQASNEDLKYYISGLELLQKCRNSQK